MRMRRSNRNTLFALLNYLQENMEQNGYVLTSIAEMERELDVQKNDFDDSIRYLKENGYLMAVRRGIYLVPISKHLLIHELLTLQNTSNLIFQQLYATPEAKRIYNQLHS